MMNVQVKSQQDVEAVEEVAVEEAGFRVGEARSTDHRIPFVRRRPGLS
jgi:hypothetical protein